MLAEVWKVPLGRCSGSSASVLSCRSFHDQQPCCRHTGRLRCSPTPTHYLNTVVPPEHNHICPQGTLLVTLWPASAFFSLDYLLSSPWQPRTKSPWQQIPPGPGALAAFFKLNLLLSFTKTLKPLHEPPSLLVSGYIIRLSNLHFLKKERLKHHAN